jgi:hypothetical protein
MSDGPDDADRNADGDPETATDGQHGGREDVSRDVEDPLADIEADANLGPDPDERSGDPFTDIDVPGQAGGPRRADEGDGGRGRSEADREGAPSRDRERAGEAGESDDASGWNPFAGTDAGPERGPAPDRETEGGPAQSEQGPGGEGGPGSDDPFDEGSPFSTATQRGDAFESEDSIFAEQSTGGLDPDEVWESLESEPDISEEDDGVYADVSKHSYCQGCEWFSAPPDATCTHEGTELVEFLDMTTVRLLNCPVVEERQSLQDDQ